MEIPRFTSSYEKEDATVICYNELNGQWYSYLPSINVEDLRKAYDLSLLSRKMSI